MPQASPAARRKAVELGVDLLDVISTGKSGYIVVADVETAAANPPVPEALPPFIPTSEHGDFEFENLSPEEAADLVAGVVLPVSSLAKMRFRQDDAEGLEWAGNDLLALRRKTAGGRYRSNDGILGWFVSDRGFFVDPEQTPPVESSNGTEPDHPMSEPIEAGAGEFGVTE